MCRASLFLLLTLAPRGSRRRRRLFDGVLRNIHPRALVVANDTSVVFSLHVVRIGCAICAGTQLLGFSLPFIFPALHELRYSILPNLLFAVPGIAAAAPPTANILEIPGPGRRLSIDETTFGANQSKAIFGLCLVLPEQSVKDAIVPMRLSEGSRSRCRVLSRQFRRGEGVRRKLRTWRIWRRK
jgi:hypothetical protein